MALRYFRGSVGASGLELESGTWVSGELKLRGGGLVWRGNLLYYLRRIDLRLWAHVLQPVAGGFGL